jgi:hypothetical protein
MLALKGVFSRHGILHKMSRIFELQLRISFVSAWTQHYMQRRRRRRHHHHLITTVTGYPFPIHRDMYRERSGNKQT